MKTNKTTLFLSLSLIFIKPVECQKIQVKENKKHVFFDLGGVLLKTSKMKALSKLGPKCIFYPNLQDRFFEFLCYIYPENENSKNESTYKGKPMPAIMCEWQRGKITCKEVVTFIEEQVDKHPEFFSKKSKANTGEQELMKKSAKLLLPEGNKSITVPIKKSLKLVEDCKKAGHKVYIMSNHVQETIDLIQQSYPEVFADFDKNNIIISSSVKTMKPEKDIFEHAIKKYKLNPNDCFLIDDQAENIAGAKKCGFRGILHKDAARTRKEMKKQGLI